MPISAAASIPMLEFKTELPSERYVEAREQIKKMPQVSLATGRLTHGKATAAERKISLNA